MSSSRPVDLTRRAIQPAREVDLSDAGGAERAVEPNFASLRAGTRTMRMPRFRLPGAGRSAHF
jgi:hypothetical protein